MTMKKLFVSLFRDTACVHVVCVCVCMCWDRGGGGATCQTANQNDSEPESVFQKCLTPVQCNTNSSSCGLAFSPSAAMYTLQM